MEKAVIVTSEFRDRESFAIVHPVGEVMAVDEARAAELAALGLVKEYGGVTLHRVARKIRTELNGVRKSDEAWKKGTAAFTCDSRLGSLVWTDLVEASRPVTGVTYQTADDFILVSKYAQNNPWREFTASQAMVVPVLNNVDRIYTLDSKTVQA